jgi:serine/threonine-protein phosphatase PGAM5
MVSGLLPTRPSLTAFSPPLPVPGHARPPRVLRSRATGVSFYPSFVHSSLSSAAAAAAVPTDLTVVIICLSSSESCVDLLL